MKYVRAGKVVLTGDVAIRFNELAKRPNPDIIKKRDMFLNEIRATHQVRQDGNVRYITIK